MKVLKTIKIEEWQAEALETSGINLSEFVRDMLDLKFMNNPPRALLIHREKEILKKKEYIDRELDAIKVELAQVANDLDQIAQKEKKKIEQPSSELDKLYEGYRWRKKEHGMSTVEKWLAGPGTKETLLELEMTKEEFLDYCKERQKL